MNFEQAAERVKTLTHKPSDDQMLQLYALYKQATHGNVNTDRPSFWSLDLVAKAKWDAWNDVKGMDSESAKEKYVQLVADLVQK